MKYANWSCNYNQVSESMVDGSVKVTGSRKVGWWVDLVKLGYFRIKSIFKKIYLKSKIKAVLNLSTMLH